MEAPHAPSHQAVFPGLSVTLFAVAAVPLYTEITRPSDIWWTPQTMLVPLSDGKDRVEIYARGRPLDGLIKAGQLRIGEDGSSSVLAMSDIGLRFNNWDRVRGDRVTRLLIYAASCAVTALIFLLILTGRLAYRGENPA
ncbi:MAG: hypothetical protein M3P00_10315 [Gemmatimonadota bacterium]|nr:hypothetical protein [Gemmatimonadota bacterium]